MTRKRNNDRPLLAGRLRPFRRPPRPVSAGQDSPALRLNHGGGATLPAKHPVAASLMIAEETANALHLGLEVFARAIAEVSALGDLGRQCMSMNRTPSNVQAMAADCARALAAIDHAATCQDTSGKPLLDGGWYSDLLDGMGKYFTRVTLPRIATDTLGSDSVGGRLSQIGPDGESFGLLESPAIAMAVVRSAALWLAAERERVFRILAEVIEPHVAELEVIEANAAAFQMAGDSAIASELAHITKLHALSNARSIESTHPSTADPRETPNSLRIRRDDDE